MRFFNGELITNQMWFDAFEKSNVFWFIRQYELKGRYGVYDTYHSMLSLACDSLEDYPTLIGIASIYPFKTRFNAGEFRSDNPLGHNKPSYAFGNRKDLTDALLLMKLQGYKIKD